MSGGSGDGIDDSSSPRRVGSYNHNHRHHQMLPPVPVDPHFNPHHNNRRGQFVDPSVRLPPARRPPSTRRRPMMYTAASTAVPVIYTTRGGKVYYTRRRNYIGNASSPSSVASLMLDLVVVSICSIVITCHSLSFTLS